MQKNEKKKKEAPNRALNKAEQKGKAQGIVVNKSPQV